MEVVGVVVVVVVVVVGGWGLGNGDWHRGVGGRGARWDWLGLEIAGGAFGCCVVCI